MLAQSEINPSRLFEIHFPPIYRVATSLVPNNNFAQTSPGEAVS